MDPADVGQTVVDRAVREGFDPLGLEIAIARIEQREVERQPPIEQLATCAKLDVARFLRPYRPTRCALRVEAGAQIKCLSLVTGRVGPIKHEITAEFMAQGNSVGREILLGISAEKRVAVADVSKRVV